MSLWGMNDETATGKTNVTNGNDQGFHQVGYISTDGMRSGYSYFRESILNCTRVVTVRK